MASAKPEEPVDPCPHLPLPDTPPDPDDPLIDVVDTIPGKVWHQFPWHRNFFSDPLWYDTNGRNLIIQKRIFMLPNEGDQVKAILEVHDRFPRRGLYILFKAAVRGKPHIIEALLDRGVEPHPTKEDDSLVPLHAAAYQGHLDCVKLLIEKGHADPEFIDVRSTPLQRAAMAGHADVVRYLIGTGKVNVQRRFEVDGVEKHPLEWIVRSGNQETADLLIDAVLADTSERPVTAAVVPGDAIQAAAREDNVAVLQRLLELRGCSPSQPRISEDEKRVIFKAAEGAVKGARLANLDFLKTLDADLSLDTVAQSQSGVDCIHHGLLDAVEREDIDAFDALAASLQRRDNDGPSEAYRVIRCCVYAAVVCKSLLMTKHILEKFNVDINDSSEATQNPQRFTLLGSAACHENADIVQYLLKEAPTPGDITKISGPFNASPLWYAVKLKQSAVAEALIKHGAPATLVPVTKPAEPAPVFTVVACLDETRQVRIYTEPPEQHPKPSEGVASSIAVGRDHEEVKRLILDRYTA